MEPLTWILLGASLAGLAPLSVEALGPLQVFSAFVPGLFFGLAIASVFSVRLGRFWLLGLLGALEQYGAFNLWVLTDSPIVANAVAALVFALTAKYIGHWKLSWTRVGLCPIAGSLSGLPVLAEIFPSARNTRPEIFLSCILWQISVFLILWHDGRKFRKAIPNVAAG